LISHLEYHPLSNLNDHHRHSAQLHEQNLPVEYFPLLQQQQQQQQLSHQHVQTIREERDMSTQTKPSPQRKYIIYEDTKMAGKKSLMLFNYRNFKFLWTIS